jgi:hypothetical protein
VKNYDDDVEMHGVARKRLRPNREQSTSDRVPVSSGKSFVLNCKYQYVPKDFHILENCSPP